MKEEIIKVLKQQYKQNQHNMENDKNHEFRYEILAVEGTIATIANALNIGEEVKEVKEEVLIETMDRQLGGEGDSDLDNEIFKELTMHDIKVSDIASYLENIDNVEGNAKTEQLFYHEIRKEIEKGNRVFEVFHIDCVYLLLVDSKLNIIGDNEFHNSIVSKL